MNKLRTDAALKRAIECGLVPDVYITDSPDNDLIIAIEVNSKIIAEISLRDFIAKRKSLRGVESRLKAAVRTPAKKKVSRKRK